MAESERVIKQVIVMRTDLGMRKGKMIAHGAHASMAVFLHPMWSALAHEVRSLGPSDIHMRLGGAPESEREFLLMGVNPDMRDWLLGKFTKVCVRAGSEDELVSLKANAEAAGLICALIVDEGKTEFHGVRTPTCLAIGPAEASAIDAITGHLALL